LTLADEAQAYLEPLAADLRAAGLRVEVHVHVAREGDVARSIVEHADELGCDVVALSTHGSGGWRELWWGNIAQQVLRRGRQPVLLVPAHLAGGAGWSLRTVLAPLDGTAHHAEGLPAARCLASTFDAELRLLVVTPTAQTLTPEQARARRMLPGTMRAVLRLAEEGSHEYLAQVVGECERLGLRVVGEVRRGEPASAVLDATDRLGADLVVMASHGRCGLDAWLEGSVAPQVAGRLGCPLLLLRSE
jgi:nucleotide-binding universal stress UspA family protein